MGMAQAYQGDAGWGRSRDDQLGADQDVELSRLQQSEDGQVGAIPAGPIAFQAGDTGLGELDSHRFFDGLGPESGWKQTGSQAGRAVLRHLSGSAAMAASEQAVVFVVHPSHRAGGALHGPARRTAVEDRGIPLAVEKQERLLASSQTGCDRLSERRGLYGARRGATQGAPRHR